MDKNARKYSPQLVLLLCGFFYATYGPFTRIVGSDFGPITQILIRTVFRILIIGLLILFIKGSRKIEKKDIPWLIVSGMAGAFTNILYVHAIQNLSMGTTMFLFYGAGTIISFIIGKFFFNEKLNQNKLFSLLLSIVGLFVLFFNDLSFSNLKFLLFAGLAGLCYGSYSSFSKKVSSKYSLSQIILSYALIETVVYLLLLTFTTESSSFISVTPWITNFVYAIVVTINSYLLIFGFKKIEAQKASLLLLSELVFIMILGILLYHEIPSLLEMLGGILILAGLILPNINFHKSTKNSLT